MIPVGAVGDIFVAQPWVDAAHNADDVVRGHMLEAILHRRIDDDARRHGSEIARLRLLAQGSHAEAGLSEQNCGSAVGNPAAHSERSGQGRITWKQTMLGRV